MIGQTLGHYRIETKLGEGGMGVVYRAQDTRLDRPVAIKVLPHERIQDPERKRRFVQEAKAASALHHPNIVHIYDIDTAHGTDFIAMEYIEGKTLDRTIGRQRLKAAETLRYAVQIADGLAAAHAAGIVHRDIKPSNIMVNETGLVKVLDFGLAKLSEQRDTDPSAVTKTMSSLTEEGTLVGTTAYMSPEQAEGRKLDGRSDIFSFGSVLYEMLTGQRPFSGDSTLSILSKILNQDPASPAQLASGIPPELEKIVLRCMRKDPARRYQTMSDLKVALEDVATESTSSKGVRRAPLWQRWGWFAAFAVLSILVFFGWRISWLPETFESLRATPLSTEPGEHRFPSFSPDGNYVSFTWTGPKQDNHDIYVQQIGSGLPVRRTTNPGGDFNAVWSPDGRSIVFLRRQSLSGPVELLQIPPLGGPERTIAKIHPGSEPGIIPPYLVWCPDNKHLIVTDSPGPGRPAGLFVVAVDNGEKRQLTFPQSPVNGDSTPAISPDGRSLVFYRNINSANGELHLLRLTKSLTADGESRRLTSVAQRDRYPAWMPDGKEILFSAKDGLWRLSVPGANPPRRLAFVGEDGMMPAVSPVRTGTNARLVYVRRFEDANLWRIDTASSGVSSASTPRVAISSTRPEYAPQFSPDSSRVAFSSTRSGDMEIWASDPDGATAVPLTSLGASALRPHWSPDGQMIVFDSNVEGQQDLYVVPASGGKARQLTNNPTNEQVPSFSRDGEWIYFNSDRTGQPQIWKMPSKGGKATQVTHNGGTHAYESRDGLYLYYTQTSSLLASPLWRQALSGGEPVKLIDGVVRRAFAVLKEGIYYLDQPDSEVRLRFFDFSASKSTTIAENLGNVPSGMTVSPDGRTILYCRIDLSVDDLMLVENFR